MSEASLKPARCSGCGADIRLNAGSRHVQCAFCNRDFVVDRPAAPLTKEAERLGNMLELARHAFEVRNFAESYQYAMRVLEQDVQHAPAWWVKGISAGWLSTLGEPRIEELVGALERAVRLAPPEHVSAWSARAALKMREFAGVIYAASLRHATAYASVEGTWDEHVARCYATLTLLERSRSLFNDPDAVRGQITILEGLLRGLRFRRRGGSFAKVALYPEHRRFALGKLRQAKAELAAAQGSTRNARPSPKMANRNTAMLSVAAVGLVVAGAAVVVPVWATRTRTGPRTAPAPTQAAVAVESVQAPNAVPTVKAGGESGPTNLVQRLFGESASPGESVAAFDARVAGSEVIDVAPCAAEVFTSRRVHTGTSALLGDGEAAYSFLLDGGFFEAYIRLARPFADVTAELEAEFGPPSERPDSGRRVWRITDSASIQVRDRGERTALTVKHEPLSTEYREARRVVCEGSGAATAQPGNGVRP